jgi:hypothetical protein
MVFSGLVGLAACAAVAAAAVWLVAGGIVPILLPFPAVTFLLVLILGAFSLAEIPVMVFAMRRLVVERPGNRRVVVGLNALYVFFASVYAVPVLLLSGSLVWGPLLCGLGIVRLIASLLLVREEQS